VFKPGSESDHFGTADRQDRPVSYPRPVPGIWFGILWVVAVVAGWTVTPVLWLMLGVTMGWGHDCSSPSGALGDVPPGCPREGLGALSAMFVLAMWILATSVVALVVGILEGRYRRFAYRRRICAVLVAIAMPWAILAYAAGNGLGRLFPLTAGVPQQEPGVRREQVPRDRPR
jgi:hypothetical protein